MKLSASPFDPVTGALLPVYRDAYLRGDLSRQNAAAVDAYLKTNRHLADDTLRRFYDMKSQGEQVRPVGWVHRQIELIRTEPQRFRRRAATLVASAVLVAGASMAATNLPDAGNLPVEAAGPLEAAPAEASAAGLRMITVRGRILDENGRPLVGATVLDKATGRGVGTDASGAYSLKVPASAAGTLHFGYGGYADEEIALNGRYVQNVTLVPREQLEQAASKSRRRWLFF